MKTPHLKTKLQLSGVLCIWAFSHFAVEPLNATKPAASPKRALASDATFLGSPADSARFDDFLKQYSTSPAPEVATPAPIQPNSDLTGPVPVGADTVAETPEVAAPMVAAPAVEAPVVAPTSPAFVASSNYNIRSATGDRLCTVPKGTPLTPDRLSSDGAYAHVAISSPGCPSQGWMAINGLQSANMKVAVEGSLALRASPSGNFRCDLPQNTGVAIVETRPSTDQYRAWVRVQVPNPPAGCPAEGWVHSEYLKPADSLLSSLPRDAQATETADADDAQTEAADTTCIDCQTNRRVSDLQAIVQGVRRVGDISTWRTARGLVQLPTRGSTGNIGPCGSFHYNPDISNGQVTDNYASPITACVLMSVMQDWKKRCPDSQAGCRIAWGDISNKTRSVFNGHRTHTEGNCVDIRPMSTGAFTNSPRTYGNSDRATMAEFVELLRSKGATNLLYNDPRISAGRAGGHDNHVHVCFPSNRTTRATCENYRYDSNICGGN